MPGIGLIRAFLEQATAKGTRATVMKPIGWMMALLISATLTAYYLKVPNWIGVTFAVFAGLTMLLYLLSYTYCLFTDKDALRSETYSIQKLAIEKGFVGDDLTGRLKPAVPAGAYIEAGAGNESEVPNE